MSFREAVPPWTTHQGLCPWTPLGDFRSPDPLCPHLQILATPLHRRGYYYYYYYYSYLHVFQHSFVDECPVGKLGNRVVVELNVAGNDVAFVANSTHLVVVHRSDRVPPLSSLSLSLKPDRLVCGRFIYFIFILFNTFTVAQNTQSASQTTVL